MQILPVIDLLDGLVVRGMAGKRSEYRPIVSPLVTDSEPRTVAEAFRARFGFSECYVADLDAIGGRTPNHVAWKQIINAGFAIWLDAGCGTLARASAAWKALKSADTTSDNHRLIVGLESLVSLRELHHIVEGLGSDTIVFSLDLKEGQLLTTSPEFTKQSPEAVVQKVAAAGVTRLVVLDLADVGTGGGTRTLELCRRIRAEHPSLGLVAGGGVRNLADLKTLATAGCSSALVASALHDGRLSPEDCRTAECWRDGHDLCVEPS